MSDADGPPPDSRPGPRPDDPSDVPPLPPANAWHNRVPSPFPAPREGTTFGRALAAATLWGGAFGGFLGSATVWSTPPKELVADLVLLVVGAVLLAAPVIWSLTRQRPVPFSQLMVIALPLFLLAGVLVDILLENAG